MQSIIRDEHGWFVPVVRPKRWNAASVMADEKARPAERFEARRELYRQLIADRSFAVPLRRQPLATNT